MPVDFVDTPTQEMNDIVTINVNGTLRVTHMVLPGMVQRFVQTSHPLYSRLTLRCRKRGLILNLGSFSGAIASPMLATYSGTKAFLLQTFSDALAAEVKPKGVTVQCLNTYFVVRSSFSPPPCKSHIESPGIFDVKNPALIRAHPHSCGVCPCLYLTGRPLWRSTLHRPPGHGLAFPQPRDHRLYHWRAELEDGCNWVHA
jgi:hypothetical protein